MAVMDTISAICDTLKASLTLQILLYFTVVFVAFFYATKLNHGAVPDIKVEPPTGEQKTARHIALPSHLFPRDLHQTHCTSVAVAKEPQPSYSKKSVPCHDPATKQYLGSVPAMDKEEVEARIAAARKAAEVRLSTFVAPVGSHSTLLRCQGLEHDAPYIGTCAQAHLANLVSSGLESAAWVGLAKVGEGWR